MENHAKLFQFASGLKRELWVDAKRTSANEFQWSDGSNMVMGAEGHGCRGSWVQRVIGHPESPTTFATKKPMYK